MSACSKKNVRIFWAKISYESENVIGTKDYHGHDLGICVRRASISSHCKLRLGIHCCF